MVVDTGENDGEAIRLLSAQERVAVACHVAEQLLVLSDIARLQRQPASRMQRALSALMSSPRPALPPALARAGDVCSGLLIWLTGSRTSYPMLDDVLRAISETLSTMDQTEREFATPLAMAASILAAAAIARNRCEDGAAALGLPPGVAGEMIAAATEHAEKRMAVAG